MLIREHPGNPRAARLERDQLHNQKSQDLLDPWWGMNWLKERGDELENTVAKSKGKIKAPKKVSKQLQKEASIAKREVVQLAAVVADAEGTCRTAAATSKA